MGSTPHQNQPSQVEYATGNPWLPYPDKPGAKPESNVNEHLGKNGDSTVQERAIPHHEHHRKPKKLIVLCDGTGQDSYGSVAKNATNIARMARALVPNAFVLTKKPDGVLHYEEWEQLVSYHSGVGTFDGNSVLGGMFGQGLSEIVRAAYGFLVNNYSGNDKIYIFGFSRGAYIARALAGLVSNYGLLTKRGMDNFNAVYDTFYAKDGDEFALGGRVAVKQGTPGAVQNRDNPKIWTITAEQAGLRKVTPGTVEVVGVYDTVGFHSPIKVWLSNHWYTAWARKLIWGADRDEFANTQLHENIKFAFHALSLDESRIPFQTTLWWRKKKLEKGELHVDPITGELKKGDYHVDPITGHEWVTTLKQVWFSGRHSDIGGGMQDPRFSNVTLAWMIAQLESRKLLAFNKDYLMDNSTRTGINLPLPTGTTALSPPDADPWSTRGKADFDGFSSASEGVFWYLQLAGYWAGKVGWWLLQLCKSGAVIVLKFHPPWSQWMTGHRTPGDYRPIEGYTAMKQDRLDLYDSFEEIHESVLGRNEPKGWKCPPLKGCKRADGVSEDGTRIRMWKKEGNLGQGEVTFWEHPPSEPDDSYQVRKLARGIERMFRGQMRFKKNVTPWLAGPVQLKSDATPVVEPGFAESINPPE